ncbi:class I SAM-dependent methyltransferase [Paenibacillus piri]|uniref:class I SAM-dependent methyltransferase n=1 Tax=Paenibacillus piri TaxID=2547395 RepID=UPI0014055A3C|nr:class I SAM-dependent methyltransferase [Paenibacillus piri]
MFADTALHPDWLQPQSKPWCDQLAAQTGKYEYPWNYVVEGDAAEAIFTEALSGIVRGKTLDVGCGHGAYTNRWADRVDEAVGYDMTEGFIATANRNRKPNVRFVQGRTHQGLPFADQEFDMAYTKKGPTSWYPEAQRILKPGADVLSLHPGDNPDADHHLARYFPGLFAPAPQGTPIKDLIRERLAGSGLLVTEFRELRETGYLPTPEDVAVLKCFGQSEAVTRTFRERYMEEVTKQFDRYRTELGIPVTSVYYLIHAKAAKAAQAASPGEASG